MDAPSDFDDDSQALDGLGEPFGISCRSQAQRTHARTPPSRRVIIVTPASVLTSSSESGVSLDGSDSEGGGKGLKSDNNREARARAGAHVLARTQSRGLC